MSFDISEGPRSMSAQDDELHSLREPPEPPSRWQAVLQSIRQFLCTLGTGIIQDLRARAPCYKSDWTDAWNYRVLPATALMFFANVLPGIAFSLNLIETTGQYGVAEVLVSTFLGALVFSLLGAQPLTISGVTGPITVFNRTIYDIVTRQSTPPNYLHFVGWVYLWAAIIHWITAILNWCNFLKYISLFSCDTFGFYVSCIYIQYGLQIIINQFSGRLDSAAVGTILALLMLVLSSLFQIVSKKPYFHRSVRLFLADYGMPISLVASSATAYWGRLSSVDVATLPVGGAFQAANGRSWLVPFWELEARWVAIAIPFGVILWVLFFFDHNVSSLMAQGSQFPLRKPPGFHWDFCLLGLTTFLAGLIGVPAPNGLIPQAPMHTASLVVRRRNSITETGSSSEEYSGEGRLPGRAAPDLPPCGSKKETFTEVEEKGPYVIVTEVPVAVVEQRVSGLAQGSLCLVLLTGPLLHILGLVPGGVLAGLFWFMGADALQTNGIMLKLLHICRDKRFTPRPAPLSRVRTSRLLLFIGIQLVGFGAAFAVTQTIAAVAFPVVILLLIPVRTLLVPRLPFTEEELALLDGPTASPFIC